jgi:hypothetical protein
MSQSGRPEPGDQLRRIDTIIGLQTVPPADVSREYQGVPMHTPLMARTSASERLRV